MESTRAEEKEFKDKFSKAKSYDHMDEVVGNWSQGKDEFEEICRTIDARPRRVPPPVSTPSPTTPHSTLALDTSDMGSPWELQAQVETPKEWRPNPCLEDVLNTPRLPLNPARTPVPAAVSGRDELTPTPSPLIA